MPLPYDLALRDIHAVLVLAEEKHFGRAAERCHITQPSLSAQVRKVERLLGVQLFERGRTRFLITPAGEELLPMMRELLDRADALAARAGRGRHRPLSGPFHLGAITTLGPFYIPHFLPRLLKARPLLELSLSEKQTRELLEELDAGRLDAALVAGPINAPGMLFHPLFHEPFVLMAPNQHRISGLKSLSVRQLRAPEMVLLNEGHCLREQALELCNPQHGTQPKVVATSIETLRYLVALGHGYTLLPRLAMRADPALDPLLHFRQFDHGAPSRLIGLACRRGAANEADVLELARLLVKWLPAELTPAHPPAPASKNEGRRSSIP
jgi:LysR family hydrogen peroxide-inducible transcriptional activator